MPKRSTKDKRHHHQWWMVPKKDDHGQWWWGYQKVYIRVLPEEQKLAWLRSMGYGNDEDGISDNG